MANKIDKFMLKERMLFEVFLDLSYAAEDAECRLEDAKEELKAAKAMYKRTKKSLAKVIANYTALYGKVPSNKKGK